jgi:3-oxoadipate enol-lactonase
MTKLNVRGIEIGYDEAGAGSTIVLLHGFPFNRSLWRDQVAELSAHYRVVTPDLRGHGETSVTAGPATMDEMARDIVALMDAINVSEAVVGGLSMGGYVTLSLVRMFPERVRALVLADTRAGADTEEAKQNREVQAQKALQEGMAPIADAMLPKLVSPMTVAKQPEVVARVREMIVKTNPAGAAAALRGMAQRRDHTDFLPRVTSPTLIIVGRHDLITPVSESELMHRRIAGSQLQVIEDAGHVANLEQPKSFNRALSQFLHNLDSSD